MEDIKFLVQGSADDPYEVTFSKEENNLTALCTCPAGIHGMYCKHRFRILSGSKEDIVSDNVEKVIIVKDWLTDSDVEKVLKELSEAENEFEIIKRKVTGLKKKLAKKLID